MMMETPHTLTGGRITFTLTKIPKVVVRFVGYLNAWTILSLSIIIALPTITILAGIIEVHVGLRM